MENTKKTIKVTAGAVGGASMVVAACVACCVSLPLAAPLLAWLGLSGLGIATFGWSLPVAGVALLMLAFFLVVRRRRRLTLLSRHTSTGCGCANICKTQLATKKVHR